MAWKDKLKEYAPEIMIGCVSTCIGTAIAVMGFLTWFLSGTCVYQEPYTLERCVIDTFLRNSGDMLFIFAVAPPVMATALAWHFIFILEKWRKGRRVFRDAVISGALYAGVLGFFAWGYTPLIDLFRYWFGASLNDIFNVRQAGVPLFIRAAKLMAEHPAAYITAGAISGALNWCGLVVLERWRMKRGGNKPL